MTTLERTMALGSEVGHAGPVADPAPVELVHHALVHPLLPRVQLRVQQAVGVGAGLHLEQIHNIMLV